MLNEKHQLPNRRDQRPAQQQGGHDVPARQQYGELVPTYDPDLPEPRKPDIEDPDNALEEGHYDRIV